MKKFIVTIRTTGYTYNNATEEEFFAKNADDAKKQARAMMTRNGHTRQDGPVTYQARVA
ncbi:hypothetical protein EVB71_073 [Rhizobium phage RHph_Y55]|nr:hypothetical protein EVB71_073 [Rhizobium phage RHph_Y55]